MAGIPRLGHNSSDVPVFAFPPSIHLRRTNAAVTIRQLLANPATIGGKVRYDT